MLGTHPNFIDRFLLRFLPNYLYIHQQAENQGPISVGVIHKIPDVKPYWKIMDYLYLKPHSLLKYKGLAKNLNVMGDVTPHQSIFEVIDPIPDYDKSAGKEIHPGDWICLSPFDRQFIYPKVA